jgi:hypothetical protein
MIHRPSLAVAHMFMLPASVVIVARTVLPGRQPAPPVEEPVA